MPVRSKACGKRGEEREPSIYSNTQHSTTCWSDPKLVRRLRSQRGPYVPVKGEPQQTTGGHFPDPVPEAPEQRAHRPLGRQPGLRQLQMVCKKICPVNVLVASVCNAVSTVRNTSVPSVCKTDHAVRNTSVSYVWKTVHAVRNTSVSSVCKKVHTIRNTSVSSVCKKVHTIRNTSAICV